MARLAAVGLLAIGVSGLLAGGMGLLFGKRFVAGDPPGITYTTARCADFFEYAPGASTCEEAGTEHHFSEVVDYRVAAGVLGLVVLGSYAWWRRRSRARGEAAPTDALPAGFTATVATALFGLTSVLLLGQTLNQIVVHETAGVGGYLSAAPVSLIVAAAFALSLYRTLLRRARQKPA